MRDFGRREFLKLNALGAASWAMRGSTACDTPSLDLDAERARILDGLRRGEGVPDVSQPQWRRASYQGIIDAVCQTRVRRVSGTIRDDAIWGDLEDIVYVAESFHAKGAVTIRSGTLVLVGEACPPCELRFDGPLCARGTKERPIVFCSLSHAPWRGINFANGLIEYAAVFDSLAGVRALSDRTLMARSRLFSAANDEPPAWTIACRFEAGSEARCGATHRAFHDDVAANHVSVLKRSRVRTVTWPDLTVA